MANSAPCLKARQALYVSLLNAMSVDQFTGPTKDSLVKVLPFLVQFTMPREDILKRYSECRCSKRGVSDIQRRGRENRFVKSHALRYRPSCKFGVAYSFDDSRQTGEIHLHDRILKFMPMANHLLNDCISHRAPSTRSPGGQNKSSKIRVVQIMVSCVENSANGFDAQIFTAALHLTIKVICIPSDLNWCLLWPTSLGA